MSDIILNELFDSDEVNNYQAIDVNPKTKVPQLWNIKVPGNDNLLVRMVSYLSKGDALKQVKQGDKFVQVFLMSLSDKGNISELRGGLGKDPMGALNTIFDTVYEQVKKLKMDAVLFRFPAKKMKGQEKTLQRIIKRLAMQRTAGKFVVLEDLYQFTGKHAYVMIYRKSKPLEDINGIPGIDAEIYTKVESKVGEVYVNSGTGKQVSKLEAIAGSIANQENARNERSVITKTKVSRRDLMTALYSISKPEDLEKYKEPAKEAFVKLQASPPIHVSSDGAPSKLLSDATESSQKILDGMVIGISTAIEQGPDKAGWARNIVEPLVAHIGPNKMEVVNLHLRNIAEILKDNKSSIDIFKALSKEVMLIESGSQEEKLKLLRELIRKVSATAFIDPMTFDFRDYKNTHKNEFTKEEQTVIAKYTARGYEEINDFLLGKEPSAKSIYDGQIPVLDEAFSKGQTLKKGTVLYRAQRMDYADVDKSVKNKVLYFPNYVSTSMAPLIFYKADQLNTALSPDARNIALESWEEVSVASIGQNTLNDIKTDYPLKPSYRRVTLGLVIKNAHTVKVIVPGSLSKYPSECEVILPRGSALRITSVSAPVTKEDELSQSMLLETSYIAPEQLTEDTELYDGDLFMKEGKLEKVSGFSKFLTESKTDNGGLDLLAEVMDLSIIPEKFIK